MLHSLNQQFQRTPDAPLNRNIRPHNMRRTADQAKAEHIRLMGDDLEPLTVVALAKKGNDYGLPCTF